jgi:excisionase family DNA binding protein
MRGNDGQGESASRIATHRRQAVTSLREAEARGLDFVSAPECATIMNVDARTIRRTIAEGSIPAARVGAQYRVPVAWLREQAAGESAV